MRQKKGQGKRKRAREVCEEKGGKKRVREGQCLIAK